MNSSTSCYRKITSPLLEIVPGVLMKFECNNPGGSHKFRAARRIVVDALSRGEIIPGKTTVIEKTGGNFGFGLIAVCSELEIPVELAVGLSFSSIKRKCLELFGAQLIGINMLKAGASPREVVEWHLSNASSLGKHYYYTDQFKNPSSLLAHEEETGPEIVAQLRKLPNIDSLIFVTCAGTGAHLTGISRSLKRSGYDTKVILVEPEGCNSKEGIFVDHQFEGMSVGVCPPFIDWELVSDIRWVNFERMFNIQKWFAKVSGYFVGNTSAACIAVAIDESTLLASNAKVLTILYDHGLWYFSA